MIIKYAFQAPCCNCRHKKVSSLSPLSTQSQVTANKKEKIGIPSAKIRLGSPVLQYFITSALIAVIMLKITRTNRNFKIFRNVMVAFLSLLE